MTVRRVGSAILVAFLATALPFVLKKGLAEPPFVPEKVSCTAPIAETMARGCVDMLPAELQTARLTKKRTSVFACLTDRSGSNQRFAPAQLAGCREAAQRAGPTSGVLVATIAAPANSESPMLYLDPVAESYVPPLITMKATGTPARCLAEYEQHANALAESCDKRSLRSAEFDARRQRLDAFEAVARQPPKHSGTDLGSAIEWFADAVQSESSATVAIASDFHPAGARAARIKHAMQILQSGATCDAIGTLPLPRLGNATFRLYVSVADGDEHAMSDASAFARLLECAGGKVAEVRRYHTGDAFDVGSAGKEPSP